MTRAVHFRNFGVDNLASVEHHAPQPGPNEVKLRVRAVSLNYRDLLMVRGHYNPKLALPFIPCSDAAAEIIEIGKNVTDLKPGDRVCTTMIPDWEDGEPVESIHHTTLGGPVQGMLAHERTLPKTVVLPLPDGIDDVTASCLPVAGLTAWNALCAATTTGRDTKVLLLGTGGVSMMALSIAKKLGAKVVMTSGSDDKRAWAASLGADHTINYREQPKWSKAVRAYWPEGADVVLEVGGPGTFDQSVRSTRMGGCVALIGVLAAAGKPVDLTRVLMHHIRVQGILVGSRAMFSDYLAFVERHEPHVEVGKVFEGLDHAADAFSLMAQGSHIGKIVVRVS